MIQRTSMSRIALIIAGLFCGVICTGVLRAQADEAVYKAPAGEAPPVAPPLRKGSPLDHLANDPKQEIPTVGYKEGNTSGAVYWVAHRFPDPQGGEGWGWIKKSGDDSWNSGKWIALQETLGVAVAPHRKLTKS